MRVVLEQYEPQDISNLDKWALVWEALPAKMFVLKLHDDKCEGSKVNCALHFNLELT